MCAGPNKVFVIIANYYTRTHGLQNIKFGDAKQAKPTHQFKTFKIKLYKTNVAIWYNKMCRLKQLTPNHIHIKVNGNNPQCQNLICK